MKHTLHLVVFLLLTVSTFGKTNPLVLTSLVGPAHVELSWENPNKEMMSIYRCTDGK